MSIRAFARSAALIAAGLAVGHALAAQDAGQEPGHTDPSTPGPMHEAMARYAGEWTTETEFRLAPDAEPEVSEGSATLESILGGRFLLEESSGTMMGRPFTAMKLWGHNNATEAFESVWVYTMSTSMMTLTGAAVDDEGTIEWVGTFHEGGEPSTMRVVTRPVGDQIVVEMYHSQDGNEFVVMRTTYTRK